MPLQKLFTRQELIGQYNHPAFQLPKVDRYAFGDVFALEFRGDVNGIIVGRDGDEMFIESSIVQRIQAQPIGWVQTVLFIFTPRYNMAGNQQVTIANFSYATSMVISRQNHLLKQRLIHPRFYQSFFG